MYIVQYMYVPRIVFPFLYYTISITKYSYYITTATAININTYPTTANGNALITITGESLWLCWWTQT